MKQDKKDDALYNVGQASDLLYKLLCNDEVIRATFYLSPSFTMKLTRTHKPDARDRQEVFVLTVGSPNYEERAFIKKCKKAGEPFPLKRIQLKLWPQAKRAA